MVAAVRDGCGCGVMVVFSLLAFVLSEKEKENSTASIIDSNTLFACSWRNIRHMIGPI